MLSSNRINVYILSIVTGAIWDNLHGELVAWDARLTSMLALMFYVLLIINYKFFEKDEITKDIFYHLDTWTCKHTNYKIFS